MGKPNAATAYPDQSLRWQEASMILATANGIQAQARNDLGGANRAQHGIGAQHDAAATASAVTARLRHFD
jgi:hypothetical protein